MRTHATAATEGHLKLNGQSPRPTDIRSTEHEVIHEEKLGRNRVLFAFERGAVRVQSRVHVKVPLAAHATQIGNHVTREQQAAAHTQVNRERDRDRETDKRTRRKTTARARAAFA